MIAVYEKTSGGKYQLFAAGFTSARRAHNAMRNHRQMRYRIMRYDGRKIARLHTKGREAVAQRLGTV